MSIAPTSAAKEIDVDIQFQIRELTRTDGAKASAVSVKVETPSEQEHPYLFSVEMIAIISPETGNENMAPADYTKMAGATLLFPFVREAVANLTTRGRYGPIWIKPFNVALQIRESDDGE